MSGDRSTMALIIPRQVSVCFSFTAICRLTHEALSFFYINFHGPTDSAINFQTQTEFIYTVFNTVYNML